MTGVTPIGGAKCSTAQTSQSSGLDSASSARAASSVVEEKEEVDINESSKGNSLAIESEQVETSSPLKEKSLC